MSKNKDLFWVGISAILLALFYWLCRYVLFDMHGMKEGPTIVIVIGIITLLISYIFKLRGTTIVTVIGYILSFGAGVIFEPEPQVNAINTGGLFTIWIISYAVLIGIGIIIDIAKRLKKKKPS